MAAGDFIDVYAEQIAAQRMWNDPRNNRELQKPIDSAMAVLNEQGVRFVPQILQDGRCVAVEAIYLKSCNDTVTDVEEVENNITDCDVSGVEAEAAKKTYTPNVALSKSIKVSTDDCAGFNTFEEKLAFLKLQAKTAIEVEFNKKVIAQLAANAQVNANPITGNVLGTVTRYATAQWEDGAGAKLLSELHVSAERNQIYDAYILNGLNFYEAKWLYQYKEKAGSAERYDNVFDQGPYSMYWDIIDLDAEVGGLPSSFLVDKNAIAFFGQNEYMNTEKRELVADLYTYKEPSMRLSWRNGQTMVPVYFDVAEQWSCAVSGASAVKNRRYGVVNIEYTLRGGLVLGPPDCGGGTGILHYQQM